MAVKAMLPNVVKMVYETKPSVLSYTPTTGQTITIPDLPQDMFVYIAPAGLLLALTIVLPTDAMSFVGQTIRVFCTQPVTALTINPVTPVLSSLALNGGFTLQKVTSNSWARF